MRIATWNVNSIRQRLDHLLTWLQDCAPDIACLQEIKGDDEDVHARFLEGVVTLKHGALRIACLYLPNGNPPETEKYPYKLKWMSRLLEYSKQRLKAEEPFVLAGDFNVIPRAEDV